MNFKNTLLTALLVFAVSFLLFANNTFKAKWFDDKEEVALAPCSPVTLPFFEGFNTNSTTFDCWTITDGNGDATSPTGSNIWKQYLSNPYEGSSSIFFIGTGANTIHDDWLISPPITMNGEIFAISYYYKTANSGLNEFEVLLSIDGIDVKKFTTVVEPVKKTNSTTYLKKILYVKDIVGEAHIAWHVMSKGSTNIYVDAVSIEKVGCVGPADNVQVDDLVKDKATISWNDPNNTGWEYFVQPLGTGSAPVGSGNYTTNSKVTVTKTSGVAGVNLLPNTSYEFYLKSNCGGGKESVWLGPLVFTTPCDILSVPFDEGFNTGSVNINCWSIVDNDNNGATWTIPTSSFGVFEGDRMMQYNSNNITASHDDWLISPTFSLNPTKFYRLSYYYKTVETSKTDFELLLSTSGIALGSFKKVLTEEVGVSSKDWKQDIIVLGAISGNVNFAWHVKTKANATALYIDKIVLEEIVGCPEPMKVDVKDVKEKSVNLNWVDDFGKEWEYVVQAFGGIPPTDKTVGVSTTKTENIVTQTLDGKALDENSIYEAYVRKKCSADDVSPWTKVFVFRTACGVYSTPFWEGFNIGSVSLPCWTIIDANNDATSPTGNNIWKAATTKYEGTQAMNFVGNANQPPHDDWLISPRIKMEAGKMYRLIYHYRLSTVATVEYEFEVMLSNKGLDPKDFTKVIVPRKKYNPNINWVEEYVFFSGVSGEANVAWHITSSTPNTQLYVDNVFIEEVTGCPEPLNLNVEEEKVDGATLNWEDDQGGKDWEYYVQEKGKGVPTKAGTSTNLKKNVITTEQSGVGLKPNTDYEFYVRTKCANGEFSMWSGPMVFVTLCASYNTPFWEGFNKNSETTRCWTIVNKNGEILPLGVTWKASTYEAPQEGNQMLQFGVSDSKKEPYDDWLISPIINLDGGTYVLKYYYKTSSSATLRNEFEVLLSSDGADISKFSTTVLPAKDYKNDNFEEQVVFINGIKGDVNLAWHIISKNTNYSYLYLDNISISKVANCEEPYYVKVTENPTGGFDLEWQQNGSINEWEVIVVNFGDDESGTAVVKTVVTGTPKTTIVGLGSGQAYTVYVRAKCADGTNHGDWSTPANIAAKVGANDNCDGAITIPVNSGLECVKSVPVSLLGSTVSGIPTAGCSVSKDVWFEFTATSSNHMLYVKDIVNLAGGAAPYIYGVLYDQPCTSLGSPFNNECFYFFPTSTEKMFMGLTPGQKYYLRLSGPDSAVFNLCITTSPNGPIEVSPSGDKYSVEELIKDVLVKSSCDLVSNVRYQVGDGSPAAQAVNTLGYFSKENSIFPFEEGVVLATSEVKYVPGPHIGADNNRGTNKNRWVGDKDINEAINDAGGGPSLDKRVTQLEFDFIPIKDSIKFEYLFASNSYINTCMHNCGTAALFAAWLVDTTTGEGQNLAKIKGTNTSIAMNNIRDASKSKIPCESHNQEYYWKHYAHGVNSPIEAPIDFVGMTVPMESETVKVVAGRKYHIKLAVMDFCTNDAHTSAVFFNASSFDIGSLDLGPDFLVETGTAICEGESATIKSGMGTEDTTFEWYRDGELIPNENKPDLEVKESGNYKLIAKYGNLNCEISGSVKVEIYPSISTVVSRPKNLQFCEKSFEEQVLDLTEVEKSMFSKVDRNDYDLVYYNSQSDAELGVNPIDKPDSFSIMPNGVNVQIFINIQDTRTGCTEIFTFYLVSTPGEFPNDFEDVKVCAAYVFPTLKDNQYYYLEPNGVGKEYKVGDVLEQPGLHTVYVLQVNNEKGCYEETSFEVSITGAIKAERFDDYNLTCKIHTLAPLPEFNKYYLEPGGKGIELPVGTPILKDGTIYVYAISEDGLCVDESSYFVSYNECPIQKGISPNGDGVNDRFELYYHNVESLKIFNRYGKEVYSYGSGYKDEWMGQSNSGQKLPDGTYYYVVQTNGKNRTGWVQINR